MQDPSHKSLSSQRCLVLGGGGFIGTNLCRALQGKAANVRAFGRRQGFPDAAPGVEWVPGDFRDTAAVASAVSGCDVVFHLVTATTPASSNIDMVHDLQANVVATLHMLDACRLQGVKRVVFVSSGGTVYGMPRIIPTPETEPTNPICAYGISKLANEKYFHLYQHLYGLEYQILRVTNPYGPYQTALRSQGAIAAFLSRIVRGEAIDVWGDGSSIRDYVYIDDVVEAMIAAANHTGPTTTFNIASGVGRSLNDVINDIESVVGQKILINRLEARKVDVPTNVLDISLATRELNWRPRTGFIEGLTRTAAWMRQYKLDCGGQVYKS